MNRARIGVIGAGFWAATNYLPVFRDHPDVELVGVVRKTTEGLAEFKREFGLEVATTSVDELLSAGLDGVVVTSPQSIHREHAIAALAAGAHVIVEKPMTVTLADARAIATAAAASGKVASVAYGWNYSRLAIWAEELLRSGTIGAIASLSGHQASSLTDLFSGRSGYGVLDVGGFAVEAEVGTWARADAGGGYLYGQLSHLIGLAVRLVPSEPAEVFARARFLDSGVDLDIQVSVGFEDGVIGSFSGQGHVPWAMGPTCLLRIAGEHGVLTLDFEHDRAEVYLQGDKAKAEVLRREPDPPIAVGEGGYTCDGPPALLIDLCLGKDAVDRAPVDVGVRTVAVLEAASRSARAREAVSVAELT